MKRRVLTLFLIVAVALMFVGAARRRSVGGAHACGALKVENVIVTYKGMSSGCATGNGMNCQVGEQITFELTTFAYDAGCGEHQLVMRFGDSRSESRSVTGRLPSFEHSYASAGGYAIEATLSNGQSSVKSAQMLMVGGDGGYDDKY